MYKSVLNFTVKVYIITVFLIIYTNSNCSFTRGRSSAVGY